MAQVKRVKVDPNVKAASVREGVEVFVFLLIIRLPFPVPFAI